MGQITLPATTARHSINARTDPERDKREVLYFCILGGIHQSYSRILACVQLELINKGQLFRLTSFPIFVFFPGVALFMAASKSCSCSLEYY